MGRVCDGSAETARGEGVSPRWDLGSQTNSIELARIIRDAAGIDVVRHGIASARKDDIRTDIGVTDAEVGGTLDDVGGTATTHPGDEHVVALRGRRKDVEVGGAVGRVKARQIILQDGEPGAIEVLAAQSGIKGVEAVLLQPSVG